MSDGHKISFRYYQTWYRVEGDLFSGKTPLIVLHGGPGSTHDYVDSFRDLAADGRPVIHYDQVGNGRSTHVPGQQEGFWTVELFLAELDNLIDHLDLRRGYMLLGHSWGGMLGVEHAVRQPDGLRGLVIASAPASMALWTRTAERLRQGLPLNVQATLRRHEAAGTFHNLEFQAAAETYYRKHFCRLFPWPEELIRTMEAKAADPTVYATMIGASEFQVTGHLHDWTSLDRIDRIEVPTQLISGRYDEAAPETMQAFADHIRDVRWTVFNESSHTPHLEERAACMAVVGAFLRCCDSEAAHKPNHNAAKQCHSGNFEKAQRLALSATEADTLANRHAVDAADLYRHHADEVAGREAEAAAEDAARAAKQEAKSKADH